MKKTLEQFYEEHSGKLSDKWSLYLTEYERLFGPYQNDPVRLLEIGIQNGGSLEIWSRYFPNAEKIIGCDIDPKCALLRYRSPRIGLVIGDVNSDGCESEILGHTPIFDIIIDDGSHKSSDIVRSFARYFPHLSEGGIYVAEDLHSSYWKNFEGGLYHPFSAMSFFKRLADIINQEHWRNNKPGKELVTRFGNTFGVDFEHFDFSRIHSVEFVNSLCIIKKAAPEKNILGKRMIAGMDEYVTSGVKKYDGTLIQEMEIDIQDGENLDVFELIAHNDSLAQSIKDLTRKSAEKDQAIESLTAQINVKDLQLNETRNELEQMKAEVLRYALSRSWRMTRPFRMVMRWIGGRKNV